MQIILVIVYAESKDPMDTWEIRIKAYEGLAEWARF